MSRIHVINDRCIKDLYCVDVCMREAIQPTPADPGYAHATQLYIDPKRCIGCGACATACLSGAIFSVEDLPRELQHFARINAAWYGR